MQNEIELIMEEIEKEPEKLKQMLRIKEVDELYQFFTENGYKQSLEKFKEDVLSFLESSKIKLHENSDLENIAGGINIKNKLVKTASVGLASLLALGSPLGYASNPKVPSKPTKQNTLTQKILKSLGITAGISVLSAGAVGGTIFAIWKYRQHLKNKPSDSQKTHQNSTDTNLHEETQFYDELQGNVSTNIPPDSHLDENPGTQPTESREKKDKTSPKLDRDLSVPPAVNFPPPKTTIPNLQTPPPQNTNTEEDQTEKKDPEHIVSPQPKDNFPSKPDVISPDEASSTQNFQNSLNKEQPCLDVPIDKNDTSQCIDPKEQLQSDTMIGFAERVELNPIKCGKQTYGLREVSKVFGLFMLLRDLIWFHNNAYNPSQKELMNKIIKNMEPCEDFVEKCRKIIGESSEQCCLLPEVRQSKINLYNNMKKELNSKSKSWSLWNDYKNVLNDIDLHHIRDVKFSALEILNGGQMTIEIESESGYPYVEDFVLDDCIDFGTLFFTNGRFLFRAVPENQNDSCLVNYFSLDDDNYIITSRAMDILMEILKPKKAQYHDNTGIDWKHITNHTPICVVRQGSNHYVHPSGKAISHSDEVFDVSIQEFSNSPTCWNDGSFYLLKGAVWEKAIELARKELDYQSNC